MPLPGINSRAWSANVNSNGPHAPTATIVKVFLCPSDEGITQSTWTGVRSPRLRGTFFHGNYYPFYGAFGYNGSTSTLAQQSRFPTAPQVATRSAFGWKFGARFADINDGLSTTALMTETLRPIELSGDLRGLIWHHVPGAGTVYTKTPPNTVEPDVLFPETCFHAPRQNRPCYEFARPTHSLMYAAARSRHPQVVNTLFGDGSVRGVNDVVDLALWRALATIADGEVIPDL